MLDTIEGRIKRVKAIMAEYGLNASQFAEKANIDRSNLSSMLNGNRVMGEGVMNKILVSFDNIERSWLFDGIGNMLKDRNVLEKPIVVNEVREPIVNYGNKKEEHIYETINNLSATSNRDSISIADLIETTKKMADTADRNSRTLEKLVDMLQQNGLNIGDSLEFPKGGTYPNVQDETKLADKKITSK